MKYDEALRYIELINHSLYLCRQTNNFFVEEQNNNLREIILEMTLDDLSKIHIVCDKLCAEH